MKRIKTGIKIAIFIALLAVSLYGMNRLFIYKSPEVMMMDEFMKLENNTLDVLCVGSSHAYTSCNTEVLWNEFGIPAFCISGPSQTIANSYYYIVEALKYQKPKVILLEASCICGAYSNYEYGNVNNLVWMPYSINRWEALKNTVPETYQDNLEWNLYYFHNRWKELEREDFQYIIENDRPNTKGFNPWWNYEDYSDVITVWDTDYQIEPAEESVEYVDKIITLCKEKNIKLVVYLSAHNMNEDIYGQINWYRQYLSEKNVDFIDGIQLSEELGIEPETDNCNGHIAYGGSVKLSRYIGEYLTNSQYVIDRRDDDRYHAWEQWAHYYESTEEIYSLVNISDLVMHVQKALTLDDAIVVFVYGGSNKQTEVEKNLMQVFSENHIYYDCDSEAPLICIASNGEVVRQGQGYYDKMSYDIEIGDHNICVNMNEAKEFSVIIDYGRVTEVKQMCEENVLYLYVYSELTGNVAEIKTFALNDEME